MFFGIAIVYFGCSETNPSGSELNSSDQVANSLTKPHLTGTIDLDFTGTPPYFWVGTVTFDTETYGLQFKSVGSPPPPPPRAFVFAERFEIWDVGFSTLYVEGPNAPFEEWIDRNVHINGTIDWVIPCVLPDGCTGTMRFN